MSPVRALLVDDEELARALVREHLAPHPEVVVAGECENGVEAVKAIAELAPDLVFLDVQMPGLTGFEVLELVEPPPAVVFVTAYDRYALRAFEVHAVDYLLKPFPSERFETALERAKARLSGGARPVPAGPLADAARGEGRPLERIAVRTGSGVTVVLCRALDYVKAEDDYVLLSAGGKTHLKHETMASLESRLDPSRFVRVHRSYLLNVARLERVEEGKVAVLLGGERLPVSRSGAARLRELLGR